MIKKNLWVVALLAVVAIAFMGCPDNWGDLKVPVVGDPPATTPIEITDEAEIAKLLSGANLFNNNEYKDKSGVVYTEKNVACFNFPGDNDIDNIGFKIAFPEDAEGLRYSAMEIDFEITEIKTLAAGEYVKLGFKERAFPENKVDMTPYADYEVWFGSPSAVSKLGDTGTIRIPTDKPNKAPQRATFFTHNKYSADAGTWAGKKGSAGPISYKLKVTRIYLEAKATNACCSDCPDLCEDCNAGKCVDKCDVECCLLPKEYEGDATTKVEFKPGATAALDTIVHTNPAFKTTSASTKVSKDGVITMETGAVLLYEFPTAQLPKVHKKDRVEFDLADYDYVTITYDLSEAVTTSGGSGNLKGQTKQLDNKDGNNYASGANGYSGQWVNWGGVGTDKTFRYQTIGAGSSGGLALRFNASDIASSGCDSIDLKITKVEFSKGTRFTVEFFAPQTPALNDIKSVTVLVDGTDNNNGTFTAGNSIGSRMPNLSNPGWTFTGWYDAWDATKFDADTTTGNKVTADTKLTKAAGTKVKLFASWKQQILEPVTVNTPTITVDNKGTGYFATWDYLFTDTANTYGAGANAKWLAFVKGGVADQTITGSEDSMTNSSGNGAMFKYTLNAAQFENIYDKVTVHYTAKKISGDKMMINTNIKTSWAAINDAAELKDGSGTFDVSLGGNDGFFSVFINTYNGNNGVFIVIIDKIVFSMN